MDNRVTIVLLAFLIFGPASKSGAESVLQQIGEFAVPEANQGVGVDAKHFYAVDNQAIGKYDKTTGKLVKKWQGDKKGPFLHLDSAMVRDGKIYAAHSNYPDWPMTSSLEIFDAETMEHMGTRSFGIQWGALNWVDWHDGHWWMTFANYDLPIGPNKTPYGHKANTLMVKLTRDFRPAESWTFPKVLLDKFELMSNSGGSWGADGFLYLTGHDPAELYRAQLPKAGSVLELVNTIPMNIRGQGIAWDRSQSGTIYGIIRATAKERIAGGSHRVTVRGRQHGDRPLMIVWMAPFTTEVECKIVPVRADWSPMTLPDATRCSRGRPLFLLKSRLPKSSRELQARITQLAREGSPPTLAPARVEVVTQIQSGSSRTDSPVRVLYAQPRSRLKLHESQDRSPTLLSHRRRTATFTDDLLRVKGREILDEILWATGRNAEGALSDFNGAVLRAVVNERAGISYLPDAGTAQATTH